MPIIGTIKQRYRYGMQWCIQDFSAETALMGVAGQGVRGSGPPSYGQSDLRDFHGSVEKVLR